MSGKFYVSVFLRKYFCVLLFLSMFFRNNIYSLYNAKTSVHYQIQTVGLTVYTLSSSNKLERSALVIKIIFNLNMFIITQSTSIFT